MDLLAGDVEVARHYAVSAWSSRRLLRAANREQRETFSTVKVDAIAGRKVGEDGARSRGTGTSGMNGTFWETGAKKWMAGRGKC